MSREVTDIEERRIAFGGFKQSGIGREGIRSYLETKTVILE